MRSAAVCDRYRPSAFVLCATEEVLSGLYGREQEDGQQYHI